MLVSLFDYELPAELIAQQPPPTRGDSRMLRVDRRTGHLADSVFSDLPTLLQTGDLLVLNDSRVLPARLFATRARLATQPGSAAPNGLVEVLLTEHLPGVDGHNDWRALVRPAKKVQLGETLLFAAEPTEAEPMEDAGASAPALRATILATGCYGERTLRFDSAPDFYATLERIGHLPLPPYIRRDRATPNTPEDRERYQTVYSTPFATASTVPHGSSAAPTAGLHFTPEILAQLEAKGVEVARIQLHVGLGTFQPVRADDTRDIHLHAEPYTLSAAAAEALNRAWQEGRRIIAVGTTTTRTLEHLARRFELDQGPLGPANALKLAAHSGSTDLFLSPAPDGEASFKLVGGLLTNFHLPQSTLLMLAAAFAGREQMLRAYAHAVAARYRFFSYGDCMLIL